MNCTQAQERVVDMMWRMALAHSLDWSIPVNFLSILGFWVHLIVFWQVINNQMATFVAENSDKMKKKPVTILKKFNFFRIVSTSGASNWQACKDSHWNKRTTFIFHKIVLYNPWTWKQSKDSLKIPLTPKRSEFTGVQKLFLLEHEIGNKIDHYISYRVFFLC